MLSVKKDIIDKLQANPLTIENFSPFSREKIYGRGTGKRNSLKGIWKDNEIDDRLVEEAKKSIFDYD